MHWSKQHEAKAAHCLSCTIITPTITLDETRQMWKLAVISDAVYDRRDANDKTAEQVNTTTPPRIRWSCCPFVAFALPFGAVHWCTVPFQRHANANRCRLRCSAWMFQYTWIHADKWNIRCLADALQMAADACRCLLMPTNAYLADACAAPNSHTSSRK